MAGLAFLLLGPLRAWRGTRELDLGSPQQRLVLAVLLLAHGQAVHVDSIIDAVWGERAPRAAGTTIRTYVSRLRAVLGTEADQVILSASGGYALPVDEHAVDVRRFLTALVSAEEARNRGDAEHAAKLFHAALDTWRAAPLANMHGEWADQQRERLRGRWVDAVERVAALESDLGHAAGTIEHLTEAIRLQPLRERLHELLILGLYRSGRSAEALHAYANVRTLLREELGVDPGPDLQRAYARILASDEVVPPAPPPPRLPSDLAVFVGRKAEVAAMAMAVARAGRQPGAARLVLVTGMPGVGKTALALHWAHQVADDFPDGQIYVDLRAFDAAGAALSVADAQAAVLASLGYPDERLPDDLNARASLYRGALAERRCLIVLDNARSSDQVIPLLPGGSPSFVVVTSRSRMCGLTAATGMSALNLNVLSHGEAQELLTSLVGRDRVAVEPTAAERIIGGCGGLPLALSVVGARAATKPGFSLAAVAAELDETRDSLDAFAGGDGRGDLRSVLSWSYRELSPGAADVFTLLAWHPGVEFTAAAVASLAGLPIRATRAVLRELAYASLVCDQTPGRYRWHELVRGYALEVAEDRWTAGEHASALRRLHDHYLATACHAGSHLLVREDDRPAPRAPADYVTATTFGSAVEALGWFRAEHATMQALVDQAARTGFAADVFALAWYARRFEDRWSWQKRVTPERLSPVSFSGERVGCT